MSQDAYTIDFLYFDPTDLRQREAGNKPAALFDGKPAAYSNFIIYRITPEESVY